MHRRTFLKQSAALGISMGMARPLSAAEKGSSGRTAQTVLGPVDVSQLGYTLPHEHIADGPYFLNRWPNGGRAAFTAETINRLKPVRAAGVGTIVDLTTYDVGRDIRFLEQVSRNSGITMIGATGQRFFPPQYPDVSMPARSIEGLCEFFKSEIVHGIDGTSVKAGVIKIGIVGKAPTDLEAIGLRAAVRASRETGASIRVHTHAVDRAADNLVAVLQEEGMNPDKVSFDHSDDSGDMDYFLDLVRRGYSLGMDHVHRGNKPGITPSFERRAECIKLLIDAGFAGKVFVSQDVEFGGTLLPDGAKDFRSRLDPPEGLLFTARRLIPHLRRIGVSEQAIRTITVENSRRFFALG